MSDSIKDQWEANAQAFSDLIGGKGTPHHQHILIPCLDDLMGNVNDKEILDAGCGEGYLSRRYAEKGAIVTGVDISNKLIELCQKDTIENTSFHVGDICNLDSLSDNSFDIVMSNLVLLNVPCFDEALQEFHRVLRSGGSLVFSIVHPAFNFYGPGTWEMGEKDPITGRRKGLFFKVDNYFIEKEHQRYWRTRQGVKFPQFISFFHRTISTYVDALVEAGLCITQMREPKPVTEDAFFEREHRIPFFLVVKANKT
jgi:ubiquinone/menaquinone biosynthesis C-methylase UbiE